MIPIARPVSRRGEGRERVVQAALDLFAVHGISGTSLQMIAESLGVTKASIYFQFRTKEEIVTAVLAPALESLGDLVDRAEGLPGEEARRDAAVTGLVDLVVRHRRLVALLRGDPAIAIMMKAHEDHVGVVDRLGNLLLGTHPTPQTQVTMTMLGGGLMMSGADPELVGLPDDVLRAELLRCARALV